MTARTVAAAALAVLAAALAPAPAAAANPWLERRVLTIAHQGGEDEFPSNTLYAFKRVQRAQRLVGVAEVASGWAFAAITVVTLGVGSAVLLQHHQNRVLRRQAGPAPVAPPDTVFANGTAAIASAG